MVGGLTYGASKDIIATVVENGVCGDDPRVLVRTNEAIKAILDEQIPVGGMATYDVLANGTTLLLPKELENAIEVEVLGGGTVNGQSDVKQGWYEVVNQFAYVSPDMQHDLPLVDQFLQPDSVDPTILRRQYDFPGLSLNATVRVTGAKRYIPITQDSDYLIVQNLLAIKDMIQAIERGENNDPQGSDAYHQKSLARIAAEVKKHQLDPINSMKRKAAYEADLVNLPLNSFGWTRARLAFELPGGLNVGKSELSRVLEQAEMSLIDAGQFVGTLEEFDAEVVNGTIMAPTQVEAILAASMNGHPLDIKSFFFRYLERGHRWWGSCHSCCPELRDEGEAVYKDTGQRRRQYKLVGWSEDVSFVFRFIAALRWVKKAPADPMTIRNFEAIRLMCQSILHQKNEKYQEAVADRGMAIKQVDDQLSKYLSGQIIVAPVDFGFSSRRQHGVL